LGFLGFDGFDVRKIDDIEYTVEISCYFLTKWQEDRDGIHQIVFRTLSGFRYLCQQLAY
jgi:hypothetical protein